MLFKHTCASVDCDMTRVDSLHLKVLLRELQGNDGRLRLAGGLRGRDEGRGRVRVVAAQAKGPCINAIL